MDWPHWLGGRVSPAMVSAQPAVMGWPSPGQSGAPLQGQNFLVLEATAAGLCGLPPPAPEKVASVLGERPRVTAWFGAVRGGGPRRGSPPGSGGLRALGAGAWRSRGELRQESQGSRARRTQRLWESHGSEGPSQNPQSRVQQGVASAAKALGLLVSTSLGWTLSPGQLAVSDGVGIVFGSE